MGTEMLAGQRHMRGVLQVITGMGCGRSQVQIPGEPPPFLEVSVSNAIGYKHHVGLGLISNIMTMVIFSPNTQQSKQCYSPPPLLTLLLNDKYIHRNERMHTLIHSALLSIYTLLEIMVILCKPSYWS